MVLMTGCHGVGLVQRGFHGGGRFGLHQTIRLSACVTNRQLVPAVWRRTWCYPHQNLLLMKC